MRNYRITGNGTPEDPYMFEPASPNDVLGGPYAMGIENHSSPDASMADAEALEFPFVVEENDAMEDGASIVNANAEYLEELRQVMAEWECDEHTAAHLIMIRHRDEELVDAMIEEHPFILDGSIDSAPSVDETEPESESENDDDDVSTLSSGSGNNGRWLDEDEI